MKKVKVKSKKEIERIKLLVTKREISVCLDEIDAGFDLLLKENNPKVISKLNNWIKKHKLMLRELGYDKNIPTPKAIKKKMKMIRESDDAKTVV